MPKLSVFEQTRSKTPFFWIALLIGGLMLVHYVFAGVMIWRYGTALRDSGWQPVLRDGLWVVSSVEPHGMAAGKLQAGDVILAINDDTRIGRIHSFSVWSTALNQDT